MNSLAAFRQDGMHVMLYITPLNIIRTTCTYTHTYVYIAILRLLSGILFLRVHFFHTSIYMYIYVINPGSPTVCLWNREETNARALPNKQLSLLLLLLYGFGRKNNRRHSAICLPPAHFGRR